MSDIRAQQAREHHQAVAAASGDADRHRQQRNRLVRQLRQSDPTKWTYEALAQAVGCSSELIAAIVKERV